MNGFFDEVAARNSLSVKDIVQSFTLDKMELFLRNLGVQEIDHRDGFLICPTICHNPLEEAESMKLYYYDDSKSFHCFTQCSESFNVVELLHRFMILNHKEIPYHECVNYLRGYTAPTLKIPNKKVVYKEEKVKRLSYVELPEYNENLLDMFIPYPHPTWLADGISKKSMEKYDIRFSLFQNRIIIPHRDFKSRLVGIRSRALEPDDIARGKYSPVYVGDTLCNHPLGFNLYGIDKNQEAMRKAKRAIIFESEKSVMLLDTMYDKYSTAVATCGSQLNRFQIDLLVRKLGVSDIILAYDKEFDNPYDIQGEKYRAKLRDKCLKYKGLANFWYIYDDMELLNKKDAPCDKGVEIYEKLFARKHRIC